ncbi:MAG TPA: TolC family protein [Longimicrobiales bacterium]|nr:TolC family protein [Longimicrobiales bacterium]
MTPATRIGSLGLSLVFATAFGLHAQSLPEPLTLDDALRIAQVNGPAFRSATNSMERARINEQRSFRNTFLPRISPNLRLTGRSYRNYNVEDYDGSLLDQPRVTEGQGSTSDQSVSISMTVFSGPALMNYFQQRAQADLAEAQFDAGVLQARAAVIRQFYAALQADDAIEVEERLTARAAQNLANVERRFALGGSQLEEVLSARVQVQRSEATIQRVRGEAYKARMELLEILGVDADADFELAGMLPEPFDPELLDVDALVARALESSPRMRQAEASLRSTRASSRASLLQRLPIPTINASASWSRSRSAQDFGAVVDLNPRNTSYNINFSLQVPISIPYLDFNADAQRALDHLNLVDAEEAVRRARVEIANDVRAALIDLRNAYSNVVLAETEAELRREQVAIMEERLAAGGSVDFLRFEQITDQAADAERAVLNARIGFQNTLLALEQIVGAEVRP